MKLLIIFSIVLISMSCTRKKEYCLHCSEPATGNIESTFCGTSDECDSREKVIKADKKKVWVCNREVKE